VLSSVAMRFVGVRLLEVDVVFEAVLEEVEVDEEERFAFEVLDIVVVVVSWLIRELNR